jgi:hypothetical protein
VSGPPYQEESNESWAEQVAQTFHWEDQGEAWVLQGHCPRCDHPMNKELVFDTYALETVRGQSDRVVVMCNCSHDHPGRPTGKSGCGAFGALRIET